MILKALLVYLGDDLDDREWRTHQGLASFDDVLKLDAVCCELVIKACVSDDVLLHLLVPAACAAKRARSQSNPNLRRVSLKLETMG